MVVTFLNFVISIPLAIKLGAVGSALGTFLCEIVICIIIQSIYYSKVGRLDMRAYYREMLHMMHGMILPIIYGVIITRIGIVRNSYFSIGLNIVAYILIYTISMWLFAMNKYEKGLIMKIVRRARVRGR